MVRRTRSRAAHRHASRMNLSIVAFFPSFFLKISRLWLASLAPRLAQRGAGMARFAPGGVVAHRPPHCAPANAPSAAPFVRQLHYRGRAASLEGAKFRSCSQFRSISFEAGSDNMQHAWVVPPQPSTCRERHGLRSSTRTQTRSRSAQVEAQEVAQGEQSDPLGSASGSVWLRLIRLRLRLERATAVAVLLRLR